MRGIITERGELNVRETLDVFFVSWGHLVAHFESESME
jgi:hypothetical protein